MEDIQPSISAYADLIHDQGSRVDVTKRVQVLGFRVQGLGFWVLGLEFSTGVGFSSERPDP